MCGIFCYVGELHKPINLQENFSKIEDRGPDYSVLQSVDNVVLGFHRLAINDLSESGHQPFVHDEIYLICNGEIYNHKSLQEKYNIQTKSQSDCEVVLHMYKMFGFDDSVNFEASRIRGGTMCSAQNSKQRMESESNLLFGFQEKCHKFPFEC